jgi:hypothetical protein
VIELGIQPGIHAMALLAGGRKLGGHVVRIRGLLKSLRVAGVALGGQTLELADCGAFMAGITLQGGVRTDQGEPVLVVLYGLDGNIPALDRVALLAIRTHLALVDVGVAIGASGAYIGKDRLGVALRASHVLVHATQRITGLIMIELRDSPDRFPANRCVAVLARNVQIPVRTSRLSITGALPVGSGAHRQQRKKQTDQKCRNQGAHPRFNFMYRTNF